jgi:hypothetical protein
MILVAGLVIAGIAGIAAAFYFSIRPGDSGHQRSSRVRSAGSGRTVAGRQVAGRRPPVSRTRTSTPPSQSGRTAPTSDPEPDFSAPPGRRVGSGHLAAGHRTHRGGSPGPRTDHSGPAGRRAASAGPPVRQADQPDWDADATAEAVTMSRSRRRVGWRKGSEVDEEIWPSESFGGVSDEQFWDDLASDKPLATTARAAAQPDSAARRRLPDVVPGSNGRDGDDRGRGDGNRIAAGGSGAYSPPAARPGPADRTVIQPVQTGPQRVHTGPQPIQAVPGGTQPTPVAGRSYQPGTQPQPYQAPAQSYQPATQPAPVMGQGGRADPRGRSRGANGTDAGAAEDPLTSAAYSLRAPGAVDGRSYQPRRSRDLTREQYEAAVSQETQTFSLADAQAATGGVPPFRRSDGLRGDPLRSDGYWSGGRPDPLRGTGTADSYGSTAGHPYPERPYGEPGQSASTSPYGETYSYGYPVSPADDPRQQNGTRGQGRTGGNWGARHAYPAGNGYRAPYDPRTNGRG